MSYQLFAEQQTELKIKISTQHIGVLLVVGAGLFGFLLTGGDISKPARTKIFQNHQ